GEAYGIGYEDIRRRAPDISKMREILAVSPRVALEEGLKRMIDWFSREGVKPEWLSQRTAAVN
ncbi:MAG: hypothetical protein ACREQP_16120, partial [Candidatus Binatia bacterium]